LHLTQAGTAYVLVYSLLDQLLGEEVGLGATSSALRTLEAMIS